MLPMHLNLLNCTIQLKTDVPLTSIYVFEVHIVLYKQRILFMLALVF